MKYISTEELTTKNISLGNFVAVRNTMGKEDVWDYLKNGRLNNALIYFCSDGAHYNLADGTQIEPKAGDMLYIPVGCKYKLTIRTEVCVCHGLYFHLLDEDGEPLFFAGNVIKTFAGDTQMPKLLSACIQLCSSTVGNGLLLRSHVYSILHEFVFCIANEKHQTPVDTVLAYINENLNADISVKELALKSGMSESVFRRVFKENVGLSPLKYINTGRMNKAALLLKESDFSIAVIAEMLGFFDEAYFCKMFKKAYGISPKKYKSMK